MNIHKTHYFYLLIIFFLTVQFINAQDKITINYADSLIGRIENGEQVREAIGNVDLTHNNVHITAQHVIHYVEQNKAELYGNVRIEKDTVTIFCPAGIYNGNEGKAYCPKGATLNDSKVTLKANYGEYTFATDVANFRGNVRIYDSRTYTITSNELDYYRNEERSVSRGNVKIETDSAVVYSDNMIYEKSVGKVTATNNVRIESDSTVITTNKLTYFENERKSIAEENVKADFVNKNATVWGDYGENFERTNYTLVKGNAKLVQADSNDSGVDTIFIYSRQMESFRNAPEYYVATDSVDVIRNDFLSASGLGIYYRAQEREGGTISLSKEPVVWKERLQVTGDSIYAYFTEDIDNIYIHKNAFALQQLEGYSDRFDQISGVFMHLNFINGDINTIRVDSNAASIYFVFENELPNGTNQSTGEIITLNFREEEVTKVKIAGDPKGQYYPEPFLRQAELRLPGFNLRTNKPIRR